MMLVGHRHRASRPNFSRDVGAASPQEFRLVFEKNFAGRSARPAITRSILEAASK
jgi:hypothetical protein